MAQVNINGQHFGSFREMIDKAKSDPTWARNNNIFLGRNVTHAETVINRDGKLFIDGVPYEDYKAGADGQLPYLIIQVTGNVEKVELSHGNLDVTGSVGSANMNHGDVTCKEVKGSVNANHGTVNADSILGGVMGNHTNVYRK